MKNKVPTGSKGDSSAAAATLTSARVGAESQVSRHGSEREAGWCVVCFLSCSFITFIHHIFLIEFFPLHVKYYWLLGVNTL